MPRVPVKMWLDESDVEGAAPRGASGSPVCHSYPPHHEPEEQKSESTFQSGILCQNGQDRQIKFFCFCVSGMLFYFFYF